MTPDLSESESLFYCVARSVGLNGARSFRVIQSPGFDDMETKDRIAFEFFFKDKHYKKHYGRVVEYHKYDDMNGVITRFNREIVGALMTVINEGERLSEVRRLEEQGG